MSENQEELYYIVDQEGKTSRLQELNIEEEMSCRKYEVLETEVC